MEGTPTLKVDGETRHSTMVKNLHYKEDLFGTFKAMGIRSAKLRDALKTKNISLPQNAKRHTC